MNDLLSLKNKFHFIKKVIFKFYETYFYTISGYPVCVRTYLLIYRPNNNNKIYIKGNKQDA